MTDKEKIDMARRFAEICVVKKSDGYQEQISFNWELLAVHVNRLILEARINELDDFLYLADWGTKEKAKRRIAELTEELDK